MPSLQSVERITAVKWADSESIKKWRDKVRPDAISALGLVNNPNYLVIGVRNSRNTLLGIVAIQDTDEEVLIKHMASRDTGRAINAELISAVIDHAENKRIVSPYNVPNWRRVGKEYWSK